MTFKNSTQCRRVEAKILKQEGKYNGATLCHTVCCVSTRKEARNGLSNLSPSLPDWRGKLCSQHGSREANWLSSVSTLLLPSQGSPMNPLLAKKERIWDISQHVSASATTQPNSKPVLSTSFTGDRAGSDDELNPTVKYYTVHVPGFFVFYCWLCGLFQTCAVKGIASIYIFM